MSLKSFNEIRDMLEKAITDHLSADKWCYIVDFYPDSLVYESSDRYYQCSYSILEGVVTLGDATEVERKIEYEPVTATGAIMAAKAGDATGYKWDVRVAAFGIDLNGNYWDKDVLTAAVAKFEGAKVFMLDEAQHQAKPHRFGKPVGNMVGVLQGATAKSDGIYATLILLPTATWLRDNLVGCAEMNLDNVLGLSVDVTGKMGTKMEGGRKYPMMASINAATVDVVYDPVAKGEFLKMAAARQTDPKQEETPMIKTLLAGLARRNKPEADRIQAAMDSQTLTDEQAVTQVFAALDAAAGGQMQAGAETLQEMKLVACGMKLDSLLAASKLPEAVQTKLRASFNGVVFQEESLQAAIKAEKECLDSLTASGVVTGAGDVRIITDQREKHGSMLDDFFAGKVQSFKACYQDITGDLRVSGDLRDAGRMSASIGTASLPELLGDSIARKMVQEYNAAGLADWKKVVQSGPVFDFRTNRRVRVGGYGDLAAVAQAGNYAAVASPTDEESTYAATKRGGTEDITLEAIRNDDVLGLRRVPQKLGRAAARTLYKFVFQTLIGANPNIYTGTALALAGQNNIGAAALAKATLLAGRLAMQKQTEMDSAEPLGISPRFLLVPADLETTAYELIAVPNTGSFVPTAASAVNAQTWELIVVKTWTDANNWWLVADPADIPTIEIGFLDGKEEPELFVQDMPNVGSMFSNDKLTYKIRHIYGGSVLDYRGFYGAIVA